MHGRQPSERPGSPLLRHRASESATELALASDEPKSCAFEPAHPPRQRRRNYYKTCHQGTDACVPPQRIAGREKGSSCLCCYWRAADQSLSVSALSASRRPRRLALSQSPNPVPSSTSNHLHHHGHRYLTSGPIVSGLLYYSAQLPQHVKPNRISVRPHSLQHRLASASETRPAPPSNQHDSRNSPPALVS
jgi:hypothetical protein